MSLSSGINVAADGRAGSGADSQTDSQADSQADRQADRRAEGRANGRLDGRAEIDRDLRVLARFIDVYCRNRHRGSARTAVSLKMLDVKHLFGRSLVLCPECTRLLIHAFTKRAHCPLAPKPSCKHCPVHCYHPEYRQAIREVMRYSGRRLVLTGRLDYLIKLLF